MTRTADEVTAEAAKAAVAEAVGPFAPGHQWPERLKRFAEVIPDEFAAWVRDLRELVTEQGEELGRYREAEQAAPPDHDRVLDLIDFGIKRGLIALKVGDVEIRFSPPVPKDLERMQAEMTQRERDIQKLAREEKQQGRRAW